MEFGFRYVGASFGYHRHKDMVVGFMNIGRDGLYRWFEGCLGAPFG